MIINDVLNNLAPGSLPMLPAPRYSGTGGEKRVCLAVESMKRHMTDEGHQLQAGLAYAGYKLAGRRLEVDEVDVARIVADLHPDVLVLQDKREWDNDHRNFRDPTAKFINEKSLAKAPEVLKLTILKDAHQRPGWHRDAAGDIDCHAWIVYYNPRIVCRMASYVRPQHVIRTWHSVDPEAVPSFTVRGRAGCLLSGAVSSTVYPLRRRLIDGVAHLPATTYLKHPGYHRNGSATPEFLKTLSGFNVAICTASIYGYALRKIIEATACGCRVITDLPTDEVMPEIDSNLIRVSPAASVAQIGQAVSRAIVSYDPVRQEELARKATAWYDFKAVGLRLASDIEALRVGYPDVRL